ncbi:MAG: PD-(D/E)XK nuclease family protein [Collinsella sp.]
MALGSAFHAAASGSSRWVPMRCPLSVPMLARQWRLTPEQRERFDVALDRWLKSAVRADLLAWPCVRPRCRSFAGLRGRGHRSLRCICRRRHRRWRRTRRIRHALVIDYKTGGTPDETPEQLQEKHALQARVYADVLHKAGFKTVTVKFVRVEQANPASSRTPRTSSSHLHLALR